MRLGAPLTISVRAAPTPRAALGFDPAPNRSREPRAKFPQLASEPPVRDAGHLGRASLLPAFFMLTGAIGVKFAKICPFTPVIPEFGGGVEGHARNVRPNGRGQGRTGWADEAVKSSGAVFGARVSRGNSRNQARPAEAISTAAGRPPANQPKRALQKGMGRADAIGSCFPHIRDGWGCYAAPSNG